MRTKVVTGQPAKTHEQQLSKLQQMYKLTYFDFTGIAEPIRMLLHYAKVDFEDVRIQREDWPSLKQTMPWNVMPVLEVDDRILSQSLAILRYLGRELKLGGSDSFATAKCDEYVDAMADLRPEVGKIYSETDEEKKAALKATFLTKTLPITLKKFNEILDKNGTGVLVGSSVTYADIMVAFFADFFVENLGFEGIGEYKEVDKLIKKVNGLEGIKEHVQKRDKK